MRTLVLSDIHGNLEALEAVLAVARSFDTTLFIGDLVGYGPNPNEVTERLQRLPGLTSLVGNHDLAALDKVDRRLFNDVARAAAVWTEKTMTAETRDFLNGLEPTREEDGFFLAHASPRDPVWEYMEQGFQGPPNFALFQQPVCFVGHTHVPRVFEETSAGTQSRVWEPKDGDTVDLADGKRKILNPGGVGQPRDGDPRAAYGILDGNAGTFTYHRVEYPFPETQTKILDAGLPRALAYRLSVGM